jgi:hypothetical protein
MTVLSVAYYRDVMLDTSTAASAIEEGLQDAQDLVRVYLGREIEYGMYTETIKCWPSGFGYPSAVPILSIPSSASYEIYDEACLYGLDPDDKPFVGFAGLMHGDEGFRGIGGRIGSGYETHYPYTTVTVWGGWTESTIPPVLARYMCKLARALITGKPEGGASMAGATMLRVGDVQVNYPKETIAGILNAFVPGMAAAIDNLRLGRL